MTNFLLYFFQVSFRRIITTGLQQQGYTCKANSMLIPNTSTMKFPCNRALRAPVETFDWIEQRRTNKLDSVRKKLNASSWWSFFNRIEGLKNLASFKIIIVSITEKFNQITVPVKIGKHGFIDSWSLINKKKKVRMTKNSIKEDLWNIFSLSLFLWKKIEQDHKTIVSAPLFKSHARFQRRMWASQLVYEARKNLTGLVSDLTHARQVCKAERDYNQSSNRQKSTNTIPNTD